MKMGRGWVWDNLGENKEIVKKCKTEQNFDRGRELKIEMTREHKFFQQQKEALGRPSREYRTESWASFIDVKGQGDLRWYVGEECKRLGGKKTKQKQHKL